MNMIISCDSGQNKKSQIKGLKKLLYIQDDSEMLFHAVLCLTTYILKDALTIISFICNALIVLRDIFYNRFET